MENLSVENIFKAHEVAYPVNGWVDRTHDDVVDMLAALVAFKLKVNNEVALDRARQGILVAINNRTNDMKELAELEEQINSSETLVNPEWGAFS